MGGGRKRSGGRHAKEAPQTGKPLSFHSPLYNIFLQCFMFVAFHGDDD